jgi:hypothetical protein
MATENIIELELEISIEDAQEDYLDEATRQLLSELRETNVESVRLATSGVVPAGTKSIDPVTTGAIAIAVLPTFLPKVIDAVQAWAMRGNGRTVKFKGKVGGQMVEFEGHSEDLEKLISTLTKRKKK